MDDKRLRRAHQISEEHTRSEKKLEAFAKEGDSYIEKIKVTFCVPAPQWLHLNHPLSMESVLRRGSLPMLFGRGRTR